MSFLNMKWSTRTNKQRGNHSGNVTNMNAPTTSQLFMETGYHTRNDFLGWVFWCIGWLVGTFGIAMYVVAIFLGILRITGHLDYNLVP